MALMHLIRNSSKLSLVCNGKGIISSKNLIQPLKNLTLTKNLTNFQPSRQLYLTAIKNSKDTSHLSHNHTTLWTIERVVSIALVGIIPLAFLIPSKPMDYLLATSVVLHNHWGISAVSSDYLRPNTVGPILSKGAIGLCYIFSILTLAGLFKLIKDDIGFVASLKKLWALPAGN